MIFIILIAHFLSDFVFQSDWMAKNKSRYFHILIIHCLIYSLTFLCMVSLWIYTFGESIEILQFGLSWFIVLAYLFGTHLIIDFITSKINTELWRAGKRWKFFVCIGADQLIHYCMLFIPLEILGII